MTDKRFRALLDRVFAAGAKHKELLRLAEAEYERRYGVNPSDVDDDTWIDGFHYCTAYLTLEEIDEAAKLNI